MSDVNDARNWRLEDPAPGQPLSDIKPLSCRASSLLYRRREAAVLRTDFWAVYGAIDMMKGLDYHHQEFMLVIDALASGARGHDDEPLRHEAVAYINRVGQFRYFTRSALTKRIVPDSDMLIPKIVHLTKFRDKHTAHRSIDTPRNEDTEHLQFVHAMSLAIRRGGLWRPKEPLPAGFTGPFWGRAYLVYQLNMGDGGTFEFCPETDHAVVMNEALTIIDRLLT